MHIIIMNEEDSTQASTNDRDNTKGTLSGCHTSHHAFAQNKNRTLHHKPKTQQTLT